MSERPIPDGPNALTPDWLTDALRSTDTITDQRVVDLKVSSISEGVGFIGRVARIELQYDRDDGEGPASLIAKCPALDPAAKAIGVALRFYENEIHVYERLRPQVPLRMPKRYYSDMRPETNEFILLIEDMAPARIGDQIAGCSPANAAIIVRELAAFHARFWESPLLGPLDWMPFYNDPCHQHAQASYQQAWPPFLQFVGDRLPAEVREAGERLTARVVHLQNLLSEPPITVMHGDLRLDNLVFPNADAAGVGVLDWQITSRGRGAFDLGYFLCTSLSPADRAAHESDLMRAYVDVLAGAGVKGYGIEECMRDYRITVMFCLVYTVIVIGSLDMGNERGLALFNALLERNTAAIVELKAYELV